MTEIKFQAVVGKDQVIRPPAGVSIPDGEVEVTVRATTEVLAVTTGDAMAETRAWLLAMAAEAEAITDHLPDDMAENHDHYAHGAPKR
ncbi:hypothetical protein P12x_000079 [Tundrisphaera lichenicola]|uniref:hypothetical protein n=1 Tax=Tundrisphaera lichenicola TaxID=2029860 RepID=UPI003EBA846D